MATIRLEDVTKAYNRASRFTPSVRGQGMVGSQADRSFSERVMAQQSVGQPGRTEGNKVVALDHVNLTIPDGQAMAVVGPSGCGKSTLLRIVAGLDPDFTGRVFYDEQDMRDVQPKDRYIGMVFQSYALYPHFKGQGNLSFFFKLHKRTDEETEERIRVTSEIMGIGFEELLRRKPGTLSGGQQQRVAIGRAIVRDPVLFLFDEPLSNLDAKLRVQTRIEIKRLLRRFQITAIYVTHDQVEAITLGDQIAVMRAGRFEQVGTYDELMGSPANAFVAGFLGNPPMNLFPGGIVREGTVHWDEVRVALPEDIKARVQDGQTLTLGVRAEEAQLVLGESQGEGMRLRGTVETVEPDFSRGTQLVYMRTGPFFYAARDSLGTADSPGLVLNVGDELEVVFPTDELYFFHGQDERRVG
jgi:ABC-type sugar transport system ATPase subunit